MFGLTPVYKSPVQRKNAIDLVDFNQLMEDFFDDSFFNGRTPRNDLFRMDVQDLEDAFVIEADLPGIPKESIDIQYDDGKLTISVQHEQVEDNSRGKYLHKERRRLSMERSIYLKEIDKDQIDASLTDGVLTIKLPKQNKSSVKTQIQIR